MTLTFALGAVFGVLGLGAGAFAIAFLRSSVGDEAFQAFAVFLLVAATAVNLWLILG